MIDVREIQYESMHNCINKNLLKLTAQNELSDMIYEYLSYIKNLKASEASINLK